MKQMDFWRKKKNICCSILSLPPRTPENDGIPSPADRPTLPWLTPHYKEHHCLEERIGKEGGTRSCQEPAAALLPQETDEAERKPLQVSFPGASMFMRIPTDQEKQGANHRAAQHLQAV